MESLRHHVRIARSNLGHLRSRFGNSSPSRVAGDLVRALTLMRRDPRPRPPVQRPERVVVTLTTVPQRLPYLRPTLRSLLDQSTPPDRILLAWPRHSLRMGVPYPQPGALPAGVEVLRCDDEGPATKLLPALLEEPDAVLVVVDDDAIYPRDFVESLLERHRSLPGAALGVRGQRARRGVDPRYLDHVSGTAIREPVAVDILMGMWGYLLPPGALDEAVHDFSGWPAELRWQDDVWISAHLAMRGVERYVVPIPGVPVESRAAFVGALHHTLNRSGRNEALAFDTFRDWWQK